MEAGGASLPRIGRIGQPSPAKNPMLRALLLCLALFAGPASAEVVVELDYRPQPGLDLVSESRTEGQTTVQVLEDRGIVAKSKEKGVVYPLSLNLVERRTTRTTTGARGEDGGFDFTMQVLDSARVLKLPDGREQPLPDKAALQGLRIHARLDAEGRIVPATVEVDDADPKQRELMQAVLSAVLQQALALQRVQLRPGEPASQQMKLQVPVPGITSLEMEMKIHNRLLALDDGVATIEMIYTMSFGTASGPVGVQASGSGGGTMSYETATRSVLGSDTNTMMEFIADVPDGKLRIEMAARQRQTTRPAPGR